MIDTRIAAATAVWLRARWRSTNRWRPGGRKPGEDVRCCGYDVPPGLVCPVCWLEPGDTMPVEQARRGVERGGEVTDGSEAG